MWKRIGLVAVSAVLLFSMAGCNIATVNEERDNKQVVAVVNGEEILKEEILKQFNTYDQTYDFSSDEEQRKNILAQLVSSAVNSKILEQKAGDLGVSLSEEEIQAIDDEIQMMQDEIQKAAELTYQEVEDPVKRESQVEQMVAEYLGRLGIDNGLYREERLADALETKIKEKLGEDVSVTDEEAQERYNTSMEEQKEMFDEYPSAFSTYQSMGEVLVYIPDGARYVKSIQIAFSEDVIDRLTAMERAGLSDYASEATIEEFEKIEDEANEALERAQSGEDIDALIQEYSDDAASKEEPVKSHGYVLYDESSDFDSAYVTDGMELESIGDVTERPVATPYGYYIIKYIGDVENNEIPYEDVEQALKDKIYSNKVNDKYEELLNQWREESDIEEYPERAY